MTFSPQTFSFEEILTSTKMNQMDTNIDEVRKNHKGSAAPNSPQAGVTWLDDSAANWTWNMYDGSDWIELGRLNPTSNTFSGRGPSILVAATSLVGVGATYDIQDAAIDGLSAWILWLNAVGGNNSGGSTYLQFFNDETLVTSSTYNYVRVGPSVAESGNTTSLISLDGNSAGGISGYINIWMDYNSKPFYEYRFIRGTTMINGFGRSTTAYDDLDGFRIARTAGAFDSGTISVYQVPDWQHS